MNHFSLTKTLAMSDREGAARPSSDGPRGCAAHAVHPLRSVDLTGGAMVQRTPPQRTLVEVLLPDADKLWDPALRQIDLLLDDEALLDQVTQAMVRRHPAGARRGRLGTPAPAESADERPGVITFVRAQRCARRPGARHLHRGVALRDPGGRRRTRRDDEAVAVIHERVSLVGELRFLARALLRQACFGIGRRFVGRVAPPLPVEVHRGIARV
jgi:hypothetical protein